MALPKCPHSDFPFSWKKIPFDLSFLSFFKRLSSLPQNPQLLRMRIPYFLWALKEED